MEISLDNLSVGATRIDLKRDLSVMRPCHKFGKIESDTECYIQRSKIFKIMALEGNREREYRHH